MTSGTPRPGDDGEADVPRDGDASGRSPVTAGADMDDDAAPASDGAANVQIERRMLEALVCPQTRGPLRYDADRQELVSRAANLAYPIRAGIPVMLIDEARPLD